MYRHHAQKLASEFLNRGDATGWFEVLYSEAGNNYGHIPWADLSPNPNLVEWFIKKDLVGKGKMALTVGCGYGDDAEFLAEQGFDVTAFDISSTAISECKRRFHNSQVSYQVVDLLNPPDAWFQGFEFVLESYTLQVLPSELRSVAISKISSFIAPLGQLLVIARGREESDILGNMPYPLTKSDLEQFEYFGLHCQLFEDYLDSETPSVRRFRVLYTSSGIT